MSYAQKKEEWEKGEYRYENALKWYYQDHFQIRRKLSLEGECSPQEQVFYKEKEI